MMTIAMLVWTLILGQGPAQASGTFVGKAAIDAALAKALAGPNGNIVDQKISTTEIEGGKAHIAHLRRVQAETNALIHDHVTESITSSRAPARSRPVAASTTRRRATSPISARG
ncbi:MAG: hypothetical protein QM736_19595 [Vicinamibacterales bacterium]